MPQRIRNVFAIIFIAVSLFGFGWYASYRLNQTVKDADKPFIDTNPDLSRYSIEKLIDAKIQVKNLNIGELLTESETYSSYLFTLEFAPDPDKNIVKKLTGRITIPKESEELITKPKVAIMLRGYVDKTVYKTGDGSKNASNYLSERGYITIAPDFFGYGDSDTESGNIFEARFQTYTTVLALLNILENSSSNHSLIKGDTQVTRLLNSQATIFIWAHSNGGQIALTTLAVTKKPYKTVLWAPVSKPFPYSVLYYTDEARDGGAFIRGELAKFEQKNKVDLFTFTNYIENINAPIQIHQGGNDDAIPMAWSNQLVTNFRTKEKDVEYFTYPTADHNMRPNWDEVMTRSYEFFEKESTDIDNKDN